MGSPPSSPTSQAHPILPPPELTLLWECAPRDILAHRDLVLLHSEPPPPGFAPTRSVAFAECSKAQTHYCLPDTKPFPHPQGAWIASGLESPICPFTVLDMLMKTGDREARVSLRAEALRTAQDEMYKALSECVAIPFSSHCPGRTLIQRGMFRAVRDKTFSLSLHLPSSPTSHLISREATPLAQCLLRTIQKAVRQSYQPYKCGPCPDLES